MDRLVRAGDSSRFPVRHSLFVRIPHERPRSPERCRVGAMRPVFVSSALKMQYPSPGSRHSVSLTSEEPRKRIASMTSALALEPGHRHAWLLENCIASTSIY